MDKEQTRAVIGGLACRFPKSRNSQEFWDNLVSGKDMIGDTHWPKGLWGLPPRIGALNEWDCFDREYFGVSITEAENMNPLLRHLLEVTHECIVDTGLPLSTLQQAKTGIYVACFGSDIDFTETSRFSDANTSPYLVGDIAKTFGLTGPTALVDTACSSSMAALHLAVNDLCIGKCDYAIVTGCNMVINPLFSQQMFVLGMLSKDGVSSVFDESANGYVRAEGCAALLISSFAESFPRVYCNVAEVGIATDGYKEKGITNPNPVTQASLMKELYKTSRINVKDIHYVEAHGTGTQVGDKAETAAITEVFCADRDEPLLIGSVKSNMGHSEATAALASIIKVILMMHYKEIPGNLNYKIPNPDIAGIHENKLKVVDKLTPFTGRYVAINSFGFGGVNGHVILEPFQEDVKDDFVHVPGHVVVPLTTGSFDSVQNIAEFVNNNRYNSGLLHMLSKSLLSCDQKQPIRGFIQIGPGEDDFFVHCDTPCEEMSKIVLCLEDFIGSYICVHNDLLEIDSFMNSLIECSKSIKRMDPTLDIIPMLRTGEVFMAHTRCGMLIATAILISMYSVLDEAIEGCNILVGCGLSEIAGAFIDECLTLTQCFNVINCIGKHVEEFAKKHDNKWTVYDVHMDIDTVYQLGPGTLVLSVNDTQRTTVSVENKYMEKVLNKISVAGGFYTKLDSNIPIYSMYMREISETIRQELRDIVPSPCYRSQNLVSAQTGWTCGHETENKHVLFDADYISRIICKPVNLAAKLTHKPENSVFVRMLPSSLPPPHLRQTLANFNKSYATDDSILSHNQSTASSVTRRDVKYSNISSLSDFEMSENEGSYSLEREHDVIPFVATASSLCSALGEFHMQGHELQVDVLFPEQKSPMGIGCPCLSPLVKWDHTVKWRMPTWLEFSCRVKDEVNLYEIDLDDSETIHTPLAVALYHVWQAVKEEMEEIQPNMDNNTPFAIKLTNINIPNERLLDSDRLDGAIIHVLPYTNKFSVNSKGDVLVQGQFEVKDTIPLPCVPGYDLDINDNLQMSPKDSEPYCEKTEVKWEDCWLDFINDVLEFSNQCTESPVLEMVIDPVYHLKEAKECSNFLAVAEKYTGVCRSGGVALQHSLPLIEKVPDFSLSQIDSCNPSLTKVNKVMVYSLYSNQTATDRVILYEAQKKSEGRKVIGIMNINGDNLIKELPVPVDWVQEDLEVLVPFILATYILYEVAQIRNQQTILILPPIDTVGVYMISLASQLGCSVFTNTYDMENLQCLESTFPNIRVIYGSKLEESLMTLTQGQGVDVCIRLSGGEIQTPLEFLSQNGQYIQCIPPSSDCAVSDSLFSHGKKVVILRPLDAVSSFMIKAAEDLQALLFNLKDEAIDKLTTEGFPESKGVLFSQENSSSFLQPIALDRLLSLVMEPNLGSAMEDLLETDLACVEKIQGLVAPKPKDYSIADTSCVPKHSFEPESQGTLDVAMMETPTSNSRVSDMDDFSPELQIINLPEYISKRKSSLLGKEDKDQDQKFQTTSTPLCMDKTDGQIDKEDALEESYLEQTKPKTQSPVKSDRRKSQKTSPVKSGSKAFENRSPVKQSGNRSPVKQVRNQSPVKGNVVGTPVPVRYPVPSIVVELAEDPPSEETVRSPRPWDSAQGKNKGLRERPGTPAIKITPVGSFRKMMKDKHKVPPPKLSLLKPKYDLIISSPITPMTPALQNILTPRYVSNLVPLNPMKVGKKGIFFMVHPITGMTTLLEALGGELQIPCYGIQRTATTPADSVSTVASYYVNVIQTIQPTGPYRLCGYSLGTLIALEMAKQLQLQRQKVERLIFLDGSPQYLQSQILCAIKHVPKHATKEQIEDAVEAGALINWMTFYGPVDDRDLKYGILRKLPNLEDRLNTAVAMTFGEVVVSSSPRRTKWLAVKEKILKQTERKVQFADAAKELMRFKRKERAEYFVSHVKIAKAYRCREKFNGDIYLHRVKSDPIFESFNMPTDYGVQSNCSGKVHLKFYEGDHESFLTKVSLDPLVKNISEELGLKK